MPRKQDVLQRPFLDGEADNVLDDAGDVEAPSDTMAALELLRRQFPVSAQVTLHRQTNDSYWIGTVISTFNQ